MGSEEGDEGRLEVCVNGAWGTVCRDEFDSSEAAVACHSLGGFNGSGNFYFYYTIIFQEKECQTFCFFPQPQFTEDALLNIFSFCSFPSITDSDIRIRCWRWSYIPVPVKMFWK